MKPNKFIPTKPTYTAVEAAEYFGVSTRTIRDWIARGLLRKSKALTKIVIPGEDVETLMAKTC